MSLHLSLAPCGGIFVLNATRNVQELSSPGYPSPYGPNIRCKWTIDGASFFDEVDIKFIDMDIQSSPDCSNDKLEIKDVSKSVSGYISNLLRIDWLWKIDV